MPWVWLGLRGPRPKTPRPRSTAGLSKAGAVTQTPGANSIRGIPVASSICGIPLANFVLRISSVKLPTWNFSSKLHVQYFGCRLQSRDPVGNLFPAHWQTPFNEVRLRNSFAASRWQASYWGFLSTPFDEFQWHSPNLESYGKLCMQNSSSKLQTWNSSCKFPL